MSVITASVPIVVISARPADLLERLPPVYQVRQLVNCAPRLWDHWDLVGWDEMVWQRFERVLVRARAEHLPLLLDSRGLSSFLLARVLVEINQQVLSRPGESHLGVIGLANSGDLAAHRLLALCPYVQAVMPIAALWKAHYSSQVAQVSWQTPRGRNQPPVGINPLVLPLPRGFLPILVALAGAMDMDQVAARSGYSKARVFEILKDTRRALGLPDGRVRRYDPNQLACELASALEGLVLDHHTHTSTRMSPIAAPQR